MTTNRDELPLGHKFVPIPRTSYVALIPSEAIKDSSPCEECGEPASAHRAPDPEGPAQLRDGCGLREELEGMRCPETTDHYWTGWNDCIDSALDRAPALTAQPAVEALCMCHTCYAHREAPQAPPAGELRECPECGHKPQDAEGELLASGLREALKLLELRIPIPPGPWTKDMEARLAAWNRRSRP